MEKDSPEHIRILIVSHTFPPAPGIGGRRWAKFAKYLRLQGHMVEVLTAEKPVDSESSWAADTIEIPVHTYPHHFPAILDKKPKGLIEKIAYRSALFTMNRKSNGSPYDRALGDEKAFLKKLLELLDFQEFQCVIVSGPPFRLLNYTAGLIARFPQIVFVADFRDPWTWGEGYGYRHLPLERLRFEKDMERKVLDTFNLICSPWPEIVRKLQRKYPDDAEKVFELSHGFDPSDIPDVSEDNSVKSGKLKLVYGGSLYEDASRSISNLINFAGQNPERIELDIYSNEEWNGNYQSGSVHFHKPVSSREFFAISQKADLLIFFIPEHLKNGVPSKLYELAAMKVPILVLGRKGTVSEFIENRKLGIFLAEGDSLDILFEKSFIPEAHQNWLNDYTIDSISRRFAERIKKQLDAQEGE